MARRPRQTKRFHSSRAALLGVVILVLCVIPMAFANRWLLPLLALPVCVAYYVLRTGTVADPDGITVMRIGEQRVVPWSDVATVSNEHGRVVVTTFSGETVHLPGVGRIDVHRLALASGGRLRLGPAESGEEGPAI